MSSPANNLPVELARLIFETTAVEHPECMPRLVLIAQCVKTWIEPLLYRALYLSWREPQDPGSRFPPTVIYDLLGTKPASFFHDHVRHVCFRNYHPAELIAEVLYACDATVNLSFLDLMGGPILLPILGGLPLQRLSACLQYLFHGEDGIDFSHPLFAQITHLDILDWDDRGWNRHDGYAGLARMPRLTHLSFSYNKEIPHGVCRGALEHCELLQVLAIVRSSPGSEPPANLSRDPRFVIVVVEDDLEDWKKGAHGEEDYWAVAEEMVMERWGMD
ncbi:hypothetical protein DFH07DRAFT_772388 [Mycena maculata]|uniref:F-box domain-containing protein n=1 Tax=Mycena maculata TaxID=230809 RepID=A0AAD7J7H4_9AGAR|nr:hypothetical protein DFH07DRAFT_772388 [Mycena maculata]